MEPNELSINIPS
jgi:hypothetical protein